MSPLAGNSDDDLEGTASEAGRDAYRGFEYQIQVSTWLLLELFRNPSVDEIEVEPPSGEDLLALSHAKSGETGELATGLAVKESESGPLHIQIKGRRIREWGGAAFRDILSGPANPNSRGSRRIWPIKNLEKNPEARFLFVTDSTVGSGLGSLVVRTPCFPKREKAAEVAGALSGIDPSILCRTGIIQQAPLKLVRAHAAEVLRECHKVPFDRRDGCLDALNGLVKQSLLSGASGTFQRDWLSELVRDYEGLPIAGQFVEPLGFLNICSKLEKSYIMVLVGEPGIGKTTLAERLVHDHRTNLEPFRVVQPASIRELREARRATERTLVYLEDPFGRYFPSEDGAEWASELESLSAALRHSPFRFYCFFRLRFSVSVSRWGCRRVWD
jgi:hypothetical protein